MWQISGEAAKMKQDIILIGPMSAGKSTVARLLAEKLDLPQVSMDEVRWDYYEEIGFDKEVQKAISDSEGMQGVLRYWKPFEVHAVERLLSDYEHCVFDFGAGHSVFDDETLFSRVEQALVPYENVILILPSPDLAESARILQERFEKDHDIYLVTEDFNIFEYFTSHPSNERLAKHIVYTKDKSPEQTCDEILQLIRYIGS